MSATTGDRTIVFDDVEIDLDGHQLRVAGQPVALEPKAFSVLALLAASPGRAFTRDEILDVAWGHRHVTPGVLNRVIALLRRALREQARAQPYLYTLHGVGYRFDLPPAAAAAHVSTSAMVENPMRGVVRRYGPRWVWAGLLILIVAGYVGWSTRSSPADTATRPPSLVVLPLRPIGDRPEDTALAAGLSEELTNLVAHIDGLRVIASTSAGIAAQAGGDVGAMAHRLGVSHALEGSVRSDPSRLRVSLRLIDIRGGSTVWAQDYDRPGGDLLTIERDVAQSVATALALRLGLPTPSGHSELAEATLYQRYLEGRYALRQVHGGQPQAEQVFRQLIADAPDYARGHAGLALALDMQVRDVPRAEALHAEAAREAQRALELDPSLADAYAIAGTQACLEHDWERCMLNSTRAIELAPADINWRMMRARHQVELGYLQAALADIDTALAADPLAPEVHFLRARILDTVGRHHEAAQDIQKAGSNLSMATPWFNAVWRGDLAAAQRLASDPAIDMKGGERFRAAYLAVTEALLDASRWPAARAAIDASESEKGDYNWLRTLLPQPDVARDIAGLERVNRVGYSTFGMMLWNPELKKHRQSQAFKDYLERTRLFEYWRRHGWPDRCQLQGTVPTCE